MFSVTGIGAKAFLEALEGRYENKLEEIKKNKKRGFDGVRQRRLTNV